MKISHKKIVALTIFSFLALGIFSSPMTVSAKTTSTSYQVEYNKYKDIDKELTQKYFTNLGIGKSIDFKPKMIIMRDLNDFYFQIPYTFKTEYIQNKNIYDKMQHYSWIAPNQYTERYYIVYDTIYDKSIKEAKVTVTKVGTGRLFIRMIIPEKYNIETMPDKHTYSSGKSTVTNYYVNKTIYSK